MFRPTFKAALWGLAFLVLALPAFAQVDTGAADFTRYVAVGDSLTAAFASGGLVQTFQANSYPALIFRQATGRTSGFEQPLVSVPGIPALLQLQSLSPLRIGPAGGQGNPINLTLPRPYDNLAVPGADVRDVRFTVTGGLHDVVLRGLGTQLQQALALQPTFVTLWIGSNDVLGAAVSGRVIEGVTLTSVADFTADYQAIVTALAATGAEMAIANLPDVTSIPYVTTIPPVVVNPATNQPVIVNGNLVPLIGPSGLLGAGDRVLLPASALLATGRGIPRGIGNGTGEPLPDDVVLSAAEISTINARVAAFNAVIRAEAQRVGAAHVDMNAFLQRAATTGIPVGGINFTTAFLTGGIFSLDGVHPTAFGYAYVANIFLAAINERYDAEIPPVNFYPFIFGTQAAAASSSTAAAPQGIFTPIALRNLFWALGIPQLSDGAGGERPNGNAAPPRRGTRRRQGRG
jgi:lysophospholipase L1-like esterase